MNDYITSVIRTVVPYVVGAVVSFLSTRNIHVDDETAAALGTLLTFVFGSLYYIVVRYIERFKPQFGALLGKAKLVRYSEPRK